MLPERDNRIPDWAASERGADMAWIHDNLAVFWPRAEELYRTHGRGAFVADTTWQSLDGSMPIAYFSQASFPLEESSDVQRMMREYQPTDEFVMLLLKTQDHESTYRVRVQQREANNTAPARVLQSALIQTFEQNDGLCLDEEVERQLLAAILSSVITDLLGTEPPVGIHNQPADDRATPPSMAD